MGWPMCSQSTVADAFSTKLSSNPLNAVQAIRPRFRSASTLSSMPYFCDFCRIFQYQPPALSLPCIEVSQTSSDSEDVEEHMAAEKSAKQRGVGGRHCLINRRQSSHKSIFCRVLTTMGRSGWLPDDTSNATLWVQPCKSATRIIRGHETT